MLHLPLEELTPEFLHQQGVPLLLLLGISVFILGLLSDLELSVLSSDSLLESVLLVLDGVLQRDDSLPALLLLMVNDADQVLELLPRL